MKILDISLLLTPDLPTWPGNPRFEFHRDQRIAAGGSSNVSRVVMGTHTGTHVDAPRHFFEGGPGVDELPLDDLVGPCEVVEIDVPAGRHPIGVADLQRATGGRPSRRLLLKTANSRLWNGGAFTSDFVYVAPDAAEWLVSAGVRLVGVDYLSVEEFKQPGAPTHHALLGAGVVIIEGLDLANVVPGTYELICLPLRIEGSDGSPARVILRREGLD